MVDLRGGITDESIRSSSMLSAIITYVFGSPLYWVLLTVDETEPISKPPRA
jgi:hypothetical protein